MYSKTYGHSSSINVLPCKKALGVHVALIKLVFLNRSLDVNKRNKVNVFLELTTSNGSRRHSITRHLNAY